jgi:hypothetical protein
MTSPKPFYILFFTYYHTARSRRHETEVFRIESLIQKSKRISVNLGQLMAPMYKNCIWLTEKQSGIWNSIRKTPERAVIYHNNSYRITKIKYKKQQPRTLKKPYSIKGVEGVEFPPNVSKSFNLHYHYTCF